MVASSGLIFPVCFFIKAELCYVEVLKVLVCLRISVLFPVFVDFVFFVTIKMFEVVINPVDHIYLRDCIIIE